MTEKKSKAGVLLILASGILWGFMGLFVSLLKDYNISNSTIAFVRLFTGMLLLIPYIIIRYGLSGFKIDKKSLFFCFMLGLFSHGLYNVAYNYTIEYAGMSTASILLYTAPFFVAVMSAIFFKENLTTHKIIALFINIVGAILVATDGHLSGDNFQFAGIMFGILSGFLYGLMTILSKPISDKCSPASIVFYSFMFASLFLAAGNPFIEIYTSLSPSFLLLALALGFIPTTGAYIIYLTGLRKLSSVSSAPVIASIEPVSATVIGTIFLNESLSLMKLIGMVIIFISIYLINSEKK